jgi:hypothetical protein
METITITTTTRTRTGAATGGAPGIVLLLGEAPIGGMPRAPPGFAETVLVVAGQ